MTEQHTSRHLITHHGQAAAHVRSPDGAQLTVMLQGAHPVSWVSADGTEQLFVSPQSAYAPGQAVRGGVPVIFPQFEMRGPLPRHGLARTRPWQLVQAEVGKDDALLVLQMLDTPETRALWPHAFELELSLRIQGQQLDMELAVTNTGEDTMSFTAALHTYFQVPSLMNCRVDGLERLRYTDSLTGRDNVQAPEPLVIEPPIDRIYYHLARPLTLSSGARSLTLRHSGFEDAVVWNPGTNEALGERALKDMAPDSWRQMLCVEAATIGQPVQLPGGETWVGMQAIEARAVAKAPTLKPIGDSLYGT